MKILSLFEKLLWTTLWAGVATCFPLGVYAAIAPAHDVNISAGRATDTLRELATQTGIQILFQSNALGDQATYAVSGHMSGFDALNHMLKGSGFRALEVNSSTVAISPEDRPTRYLELQQSDENEVGPGPASSRAMPSERTSSAIPEILVKGSRSMNTAIEHDEDGVQAYVVLDKSDIERSGATTVEGFLRQNLTAVTPSGVAEQNSLIAGNASKFSLRGLGAGETLILINGRRSAAYSGAALAQQPDLNSIPLSAIERIEVLPSTASGIFGGGATGGVINVILRQDYDGVNVSTTYGNTIRSDAASRRIGVSAGFNFNGGKTNFVVTGAFSDTDRLYVGDREFQERALQLTFQNNPSSFTNSLRAPLGATTNILSSASVLQLKPAYGGAILPQRFTYVPYGYDGVSSDNGAALVANAGKFNLDLPDTAQSSGRRRTLLSGPTTKSASATIHHQISEQWELFSEISASRNVGIFTTNGGTTSYTLASTAPSNPFVQSVRITTPAFGLDGSTLSDISTRRLVGGAAFSIGTAWHGEIEYAWSSSRTIGDTPSSATSPGLAQVASGEINLFRDTNEFRVDFSSYTPPKTTLDPVTTRLKNPSLRIGGELPLLLPGGRPTITGAVEHRSEEMDSIFADGPVIKTYYPARSQAAESLYMEARVPIVASRNSLPGMKELTLQLAGRHDRYKTDAANTVTTINGIPTSQEATRRQSLSSTDPTVGIRYVPLSGVAFRASFATGFLPPTVSQIVPDATVTTTLNPGALFDPRRGNESVVGSISIANGGNPDLQPELARSWTLGVILEPPALPGLRIAVDHTKLRKRDNISQFFLNQTLIDNESYVSGLVTRAPATPQNDPLGYGVGPIIGVSQALLNFARLNVDAYDLALDYRWLTNRWGTWMFSAKTTRTTHLQTKSAPTAPLLESVGTVATLKWQGNASLTWEFGGFGAGWQTRYFDKYWINLDHSISVSQGSTTIPSQNYNDVFMFYRTGDRLNGSSAQAGRLLDSMTIRLGVENVFNREPPLSVATAGGVSSFGDQKLARYYLTLEKAF